MIRNDVHFVRTCVKRVDRLRRNKFVLNYDIKTIEITLSLLFILMIAGGEAMMPYAPQLDAADFLCGLLSNGFSVELYES